MKNTVFLSLVVVGIFLLSSFGVIAENYELPIVAPNISKAARSSTILSEDFSGSSFSSLSSGAWSVLNDGSGNVWTLDTSDQRSEVKYSSSSNTENTYLVTPTINLAGYNNAQLSFHEVWKGGYGSYWSYGYIYGSTDGGSTWSAYQNTLHACDASAAEEEVTNDVTLDMGWADGQSNVKVAWRYYANYDWYWYVDNVVITGIISSSDVELTSGVGYSGSLSATSDKDYYKINVPSGSTKLDVVLDGPSSGCDFDLYVKYNQQPTTSSYDGRGYTSSSDEIVTINSPSTGYYYIMPYSYSGSGSYTITATVTGSSDTTPPAISSVQASSVTSSGATITWTTNEASSSVVEYGTTTSYGSTATGSDGVTSHSVSLSGLSAGTTHHYRVKSTDISGNTATSSDYTFTTSSASSDIELTSGVGYSDSLSATGEKDYYKINVPSGSTKLDVVLDGPSSGCDFDLYVKYNQRPTTSSYDGRGYTSSSDETVTISNPSAGLYYIMPRSYSGSGSYTITATVTGSGGGTTDVELTSGVGYSGSLSATSDKDYYKINVPSGSTKLDVVLDGPSSGCDFDLYVKYNQQPTTSSYDGRGYTSSSDETVTINSPSTGYYYIMPRSYSGSGSYTITATATSGGGGTGNKWALVIGISNYQSINDLSYCDEDANAWTSYLQGKGYTVHTLIDSQATEAAIYDEIDNWLLPNEQAGDYVAITFAGHGGHQSEGGYSSSAGDQYGGQADGHPSLFFAYDADTNGHGCILDNVLAHHLSTLDSTHVFIFFDSCRSGGMDEVAGSSNSGRYVSETCGWDEYGYDDASHSHGAWTYWFLVWGLESQNYADCETCYPNAYTKANNAYSGMHPEEEDHYSGAFVI